MNYNSSDGNSGLGSRVRNLLPDEGPLSDIDLSQGMSVPDEPGPAMMGRTPVIGQIRRARDLPVLRDRLPDLTE